MTMTEQSVVIGVFRDRALAEQAISELKRALFHDDQISLLEHNKGGFLASLKTMFAGPDVATDNADDLTRLGIPQDDTHYYQDELDAGHSIVVVQAYERRQEARDILFQHGAYNAATGATGGVEGSLSDTGNRTVPIREEELQIHKTWVQTGEVRISKRVITEQKTFTVPVQREEVIIERLPFAGGAANRQTDNGAAGIERQPITNRSNAAIDDDATVRSPATGLNPSAVGDADVDANAQEMLREDGTIRILVREEQVAINKQTVVVEEIVVSKQHVQEMRQIAETVRHEEVHVERKGDVRVQGDVEDTVGTTE